MSASDIEKTAKAILEKMAELSRLFTSVMPPEKKRFIGQFVELMVTNVTNTAFDLMGRAVSFDKDLVETRQELMKEVTSSWIALVEKIEELSIYMPTVAEVSIWRVVDKSMDLGMKIGAVSATGTIDVREKMMKKLMENLKKTARDRGYIV